MVVCIFQDIREGHFDTDIRDHQWIHCHEHRDEFVQYFCAKCDDLICRECKLKSDHKDHSISDIQKAGKLFPTDESITTNNK